MCLYYNLPTQARGQQLPRALAVSGDLPLSSSWRSKVVLTNPGDRLCQRIFFYSKPRNSSEEASLIWQSWSSTIPLLTRILMLGPIGTVIKRLHWHVVTKILSITYSDRPALVFTIFNHLHHDIMSPSTFTHVETFPSNMSDLQTSSGHHSSP